jgi:tetratricopeptide (TPR) repeat protein
LLAVLLVLVTMTLYWPATRCSFVNLDDDLYVTANAHVQNGLTLEGIQWALLNPVAENWHPLTVWSHMLVYQLCGSNPRGHHLINVMLHTLNVALVFALLQLMTGATWRSLFVAALFAAHPLRVESVAWVTERKGLLSTCFGLLSLVSYVLYAQDKMRREQYRIQKGLRGNEEGRRQNAGMEVAAYAPAVARLTVNAARYYQLSLLSFALGLMSKPMLVTWPFVMLLLDYWPLRRIQKPKGIAAQSSPSTKPALPLIVEKIPFFGLAMLMSVVTLVEQKRGGALEAGEGLGVSARLGNALVSYGLYLEKTLWAAKLAVLYPHPGYWPARELVVAGMAMLGISVAVWLQRRRYPFLLTGWLWFLGTLVPVIGLVQVGQQAMADRYTYIPSLGVLILGVWAACELSQHQRHRVLVLSLSGGAAFVLCLALTRRQIGYWKDSVSLFRHALEVTDNNWVAHDNLGTALGDKGQSDEAIRHYQEAIRLKPGDAKAHDNLGVALYKKGQIDKAIRCYQEAIRLKPRDAKAHNNLGAALADRGQGDEAIRCYQEAIRLQPDYAEAHSNLGIALGRKGQIEEAIRQFQEAVRWRPHSAEAHSNLGIAFGRMGRVEEAIRQFQEAIHLRPDYAEAHNNLGIVFYQQSRTDEAIRQFQETLSLKPDLVDTRRNLEIALAAKARSSPPSAASTNR